MCVVSLLPVPCLCLPSKLNRAVLFLETNTYTYTILHLYPNLDIHIVVYNSIRIYKYIYVKKYI